MLVLRGHGGGVAAFISNDVNYVLVNIDQSFAALELVCFDIIFSVTRLRLFIVYRPPCNDQSGVTYTDCLIRCLNQYSARDHVNIVVGDFNCRKIHWASHTSPNDPINTAIFNWATSGGFTQHVDFPTRGQNTLDVVFADDDQIINRIVAEPPLGVSDHCVINFVLTVENSQCASNVYADA